MSLWTAETLDLLASRNQKPTSKPARKSSPKPKPTTSSNSPSKKSRVSKKTAFPLSSKPMRRPISDSSPQAPSTPASEGEGYCGIDVGKQGFVAVVGSKGVLLCEAIPLIGDDY